MIVFNLRSSVVAIVLAGICAGAAQATDALEAFPFRPGETIQYDIKKLAVKAGEATLTFQGLVSLEGQSAFLITFASKGLKFFDEEKIYLDPPTFLPKRVERDLNIFGKKEEIIEYYNAQEG